MLVLLVGLVDALKLPHILLSSGMTSDEYDDAAVLRMEGEGRRVCVPVVMYEACVLVGVLGTTFSSCEHVCDNLETCVTCRGDWERAAVRPLLHVRTSPLLRSTCIVTTSWPSLRRLQHFQRGTQVVPYVTSHTSTTTATDSPRIAITSNMFTSGHGQLRSVSAE